MMISVLLFIYLLLYNVNNFIGIFLYLMIYFCLLFGFYLFGVDFMKGDLFYMFGFDYISFYLILLVIWLMSLILILFYNFFLCILVLSLFFGLFIMFCSLDLLYMFIFFEFSMLPMFLMIMFYGGYKERYVASLYMIIYTMISSLPMLIILFNIIDWLGSLNFDYMMYGLVDFDDIIIIIMLFMFLVKVPMFMLHIWLPKAHVEAPVYGSMILASIMLKMGGYGIIRCMDIMIINSFVSDFFFCLCLCGSLMISYMCLYQVDLKVLVAYSSVIHMGMMLMGFFSKSEMGYLGGLIMLLSHGICSSGLFYLVNEIYCVTGSRLLLLNSGLMSFVPILTWFWLFMLVMNLGSPPCFGIIGELLLMGGCLTYSFLIFFLFFFMVFFISCFVMNMYGLLVGGLFLSRFVGINLLVCYGSFAHLIPLNFFIIFMYICF